MEWHYGTKGEREKRIKTIRITIALVLLAWTTTQADTFIVNPGESIQAALNLSTSGDIVELTAGSWQENLSIPDHALVLRGAVDKSGAPASSIDGGGDRAITIMVNMSNVSIEHLTITGQHATAGGGAYIFRSNPSFANCRFENCSVAGTTYYDGGGAVYMYGSSPTHVSTFDGCAFIDNSGNKGGAIGLRASSSIYEYSAVVVNCLFQGNTAVEHGGAIGAIYSPDQGVDLEQCDFINNSATSNQGHAISNVLSVSTSLHSCNIVLDGADSDDLVTGTWEDLGHNCLSVVWADADGDLRPDDCDQCDGPEFDLDGNGWSDCAQVDHGDGTFTLNVAGATQIQPALDFVLAGFIVDLAPGSYFTPAGGLDIPNIAFSLSGAIDKSGDPASSIDGGGDRAITIMENMSNVSIEHLTITGQHATTGGGAYIFRSNPSFANCRFENCSASGTGAFEGGGAVYMYGTSPTHVSTFDGCAFIGNSGNKGGAIGLRASSSIYEYSAVVLNCLFRDNTANYGGAVCGIYTYDHGINIDQCLFFNNTAAIEGSAIAYTSSVATSIGNSAFCGLDPIIIGTWEDLGGNCFSETCEDLDGDSIPDDCDDVIDEGCSADIDGDGVVDIQDVLQILSDWGSSGSDVNGDGITNILDLLVAISQWGDCP